MSIKRFVLLAAAVVMILSPGVYAANTPAKDTARRHLKFFRTFPIAQKSTYEWPVTGQIPSLKEKIKKFESRSLASDYSVSDKDLSAKLIEIRNKFLAVSTADDLDTEIKSLDDDATYAALPPDAQYVAAQLAILIPFRGIVYKTTKLAISTHATDTGAFYGITQVASLMNVLLPTDQWQAVFDYLVSSDPASPSQFTAIGQVQDYLVQSILPALDRASTRFAQLGKNMGETPFYFDRLLLYGTANFQDDVDNYKFRYAMVGPAEIAGALAAIQFAMHDILVFSAYNADSFLNVEHSVATLFAQQGVLLGNMEGLVAQRRVQVLTGNGKGPGKFSSYLTAVGGVDKAHSQSGWYTQAQMPVAFSHLQEGIKDLALAWGVVQSEKDYDLANQYAMFKPVRILPWSQVVDLRLKTLQDMVNGQTAIKSFVTGETITVNLPNYYENPPTDLKGFLPTGFEPANKTRAAKYFRDYYYGRPMAWQLDKYAPYVTIPAGASPSYIRDVTRILAQSWAGLNVAAPLIAVVR